MADVRLIWSIRDAKTSLTTLLGKGQIGDDLWERFLNAEKELEAEILEVVGEANTFQEGYGQQIFGIASEMVSHERWKEIYEGIGKKREEESEWSFRHNCFPRNLAHERVFLAPCRRGQDGFAQPLDRPLAFPLSHPFITLTLAVQPFGEPARGSGSKRRQQSSRSPYA